MSAESGRVPLQLPEIMKRNWLASNTRRTTSGPSSQHRLSHQERILRPRNPRSSTKEHRTDCCKVLISTRQAFCSQIIRRHRPCLRLRLRLRLQRCLQRRLLVARPGLPARPSELSSLSLPTRPRLSSFQGLSRLSIRCRRCQSRAPIPQGHILLP